MGIEPANSGFADRRLTTWLPRRLQYYSKKNIVLQKMCLGSDRCETEKPFICRNDEKEIPELLIGNTDKVNV